MIFEDWIPYLPAVNAMLNGISTVLLILGRGHIVRARIAAHRACMIAAFLTSALFLVSYLVSERKLPFLHSRADRPPEFRVSEDFH